jgi:alkylation response protein AidB-like acyl-CoA dehydrogenase
VLHGAGGAGADYLFDVIVFEEMARSGFTGPGFLIHCDLVATYIASFGSEAQKKKWLPQMVRGEAIGSLGMTEPHAGSDLKRSARRPCATATTTSSRARRCSAATASCAT